MAARVTQEGILAAAQGTPNARITQEGVLAVTQGTPNCRVSQAGLLVVTPYYVVNSRPAIVAARETHRRPGRATVVALAALALVPVPPPVPYPPVIARKLPVPARGGAASFTGLRAALLPSSDQIVPPKPTIARTSYMPPRSGRVQITRGVSIEVPLAPVVLPIVARPAPQQLQGGSVAIVGMRAAAPPAIVPSPTPPLIFKPRPAPGHPGHAWVSSAVGAVQTVPDTAQPTIVVARRSLRPARGGSAVMGLSAALFLAPAPVPTTPVLPVIARPGPVPRHIGTTWSASNIGTAVPAPVPPGAQPSIYVASRAATAPRRGHVWVAKSRATSISIPVIARPTILVARRTAEPLRRGRILKARTRVVLPVAPISAQPKILIAKRAAMPPRRGRTIVGILHAAQSTIPGPTHPARVVVARRYALVRGGRVFAPPVQIAAAAEVLPPPIPPDPLPRLDRLTLATVALRDLMVRTGLFPARSVVISLEDQPWTSPTPPCAWIKPAALPLDDVLNTGSGRYGSVLAVEWTIRVILRRASDIDAQDTLLLTRTAMGGYPIIYQVINHLHEEFLSDPVGNQLTTIALKVVRVGEPYRYSKDLMLAVVPITIRTRVLMDLDLPDPV